MSQFAVGLRFTPADAPRLDHLAERARQMELPAAHDLIASAAAAAHRGEPLLLFCVDAAEAIDYAQRFANWGVDRPVIETLNGLLI